MNEDFSFPPFSLKRLLSTCFGPGEGEGDRICILIDFPDPQASMKDLAFLDDGSVTVQRYAHDVFHQGLADGVLGELNYRENGFYAFRETGGSNLDMEDDAWDSNGTHLSLERDVYPQFDLILAITNYSATAPLTAHAKRHGFRGATLHGLNQIILDSGLAVDYHQVSAKTEKLRLALTGADRFELDFTYAETPFTLNIECGGQEAQKSHGLCPRGKPDVANLPAGEVYFVPVSAEGSFPFQYSDGSVSSLAVKDGAIHSATLLSGRADVVEQHNGKLRDDPATGLLGELGFGTQVLPFSGRDIQDEKILGTCHVATGRSDHLGGNLTPALFKSRENASHDDVLYAPEKTPDIAMPEVRMRRNGDCQVVLSKYQPTNYLLNALTS
tara:strand:+ start:1476 stop:2630 length:1155 start_codon:yes stop_codon:yes gene_type:complete